MKRTVLAVMTTALALAGCGPQGPATEEGQLAPLLEGMGAYHYAITTSSPRAQRFFDQGLVLSYGFNHAEAERAFREAARLDPECAMCSWGIALVLGPNINAPMDDENVPLAYVALQEALRLAPGAGEAERAYIEALARRYAPELVEDRVPLDEAYAAAMADVAQRFPDDLNAATLHAEALMDLHPWDFWTREGEPKPWTPEILETLEKIIEREPDNPGANHFYIHAVEASHEPGRALPSAERLGGLAPGAGHLVHMPAHIFIRTGRYRDASEANVRAIAADDSYVTQCHAQGIYPLAYMPHNRHFLWAAATLEGRGAEAIGAAREMSSRIDHDKMREPGRGTLQHFWITPLYALVRFGKWEEILAEAEPDEDLIYPRGVWHYARSVALSRTGRAKEAQQELDAMLTIAADERLQDVTVWDINGSVELMQVAVKVVRGELALARGDSARALA